MAIACGIRIPPLIKNVGSTDPQDTPHVTDIPGGIMRVATSKGTGGEEKLGSAT